MKLTASKFSTLIASVALLLTSCTEVTKDSKKAAELSHGIILKNMDTTINPKDDFYNYVNGNWMKNTKIPKDRTIWGGFSVLRKSTDKDVLDILAKAKKNGNYNADTDQAKALFLFDSKLDIDTRNAAGINPLQPALDAIASINNLNDLQTVLMTVPNVSSPFMEFVSFGDLNDSTINAAYLTENGLGLGERDYYLDMDTKSVEIRSKYVEHISRMLQFLGDDEISAIASAEKILTMETELAIPRMDKVQSRDMRNYNNPTSISDIQLLIPSFDIQKMIADKKIKQKIDTLIVTQPKFIIALNSFLTKHTIDDIKTLLRWDTFVSSAGRLTEEIEVANWEFYSNYLRDAKEMRPAKERALAVVNNNIGEALGQLYVDAKFPPEAKEKAEVMIANVIAAYQARIQVLDWMSTETKTKAIEKLDKFTVKIGYPDTWEDYSTMEVKKSNTYFENISAINKWSTANNLSEIGEPVDKTEWGMSPQTVNAYFNPLNNEIVFPAAILQAPFYDYLADDAVNYGGIGAVIGHEISHAFDDSGARFDANGNLVNWWSEEDLKQFTTRGDALATQYSKIEVLDSVYINGKFTLGENIGDLGGVLGAYDGLQMLYEKNGRPEDIDGFTAEQRFFMSWATVWRTLTRDEELRNRIKTDPHSPGRTRATQPLINIDTFYEAFDIKEGDGMFVPVEERVRIW
ncbi:M13 family metallopeptidase [Flavobacteriaceae bacterium]|nr:M13 family metallopeptidase [Flavobacteriaceae bacterium]MDB4127269.1 M13 family metallopeptidase [Flavobacteriaceae bacterium]MDB9913277.1 M13 family metallopeptidase [Flavobacteriaceae bacterium]MDB9989627.1 M13 family metallopeptidase [Flavobacteriaceae bacterium]MDB9993861.1 M13 family metallopeptidase [Flavobacteriaceae bacterium]